MTLPIERLAAWIVRPKCRNCGGVRERSAEFCSETCADEWDSFIAI